ncbi:MAG: argininosuccinate lyase [Fimbriimonadaceae bacterium]|nr:argininosuccinate lyase [Fimbriimonadaceae bacterium]
MPRLWDKGESIDELILSFTVGEDHILDARLVPYDIRASQAHAAMLAECGHLTYDQSDSLCDALMQLGEQHARGEWTIRLDEEDVHTAIENRLVAWLGDLGERIHLGRSRNDQVLAALRLYLRDVVAISSECTTAVVTVLQQLASSQGDIPLPGYTHLQPAMPSTVALWANGFAAELTDDVKMIESALTLIDKNPLGSAAGYGTPGIPINRERTTRDLQFKETHEPVTAVQLSRGKAEASLAFALCLVQQDLGRLAADLCLYATQEFAFVRLPKEFTTGSSIMPQKRNPDIFELVRGHSSQAPADLQAILAITSKMTSGYHRDLQLIKGPLFRMIDSTLEMLRVMEHAIPGVQFNAQRTSEAMDPSLYSAERAFELVQEQGISFREAYRRIASELEKGLSDSKKDLHKETS